MLSTTKVAVVEAFRGGHDVFEVPLWLRLEQNHIDDAETVFRRLQDVFFSPVFLIISDQNTLETAWEQVFGAC